VGAQKLDRSGLGEAGSGHTTARCVACRLPGDGAKNRLQELTGREGRRKRAQPSPSSPSVGLPASSSDGGQAGEAHGRPCDGGGEDTARIVPEGE
jgi:hypothetical protein